MISVIVHWCVDWRSTSGKVVWVTTTERKGFTVTLNSLIFFRVAKYFVANSLFSPPRHIVSWAEELAWASISFHAVIGVNEFEHRWKNWVSICETIIDAFKSATFIENYANHGVLVLSLFKVNLTKPFAQGFDKGEERPDQLAFNDQFFNWCLFVKIFMNHLSNFNNDLTWQKSRFHELLHGRSHYGALFANKLK